MPAGGSGAAEDDPPAPVGEYAQSCLGRERVVEFVSRERRLRGADLPAQLRRGSALRHAGGRRAPGHRRAADRPDDGVLQRHLAGRREQLRLPQPGALLLAAGASSTSRDRSGSRFARPPSGSVPRSAAHPLREHRGARGAPQRFEPLPRPAGRTRGPPRRCCAGGSRHWVGAGGSSLGKPTHFEVTDGRY